MQFTPAFGRLAELSTDIGSRGASGTLAHSRSIVLSLLYGTGLAVFAEHLLTRLASPMIPTHELAAPALVALALLTPLHMLQLDSRRVGRGASWLRQGCRLLRDVRRPLWLSAIVFGAAFLAAVAPHFAARVVFDGAGSISRSSEVGVAMISGLLFLSVYARIGLALPIAIVERRRLRDCLRHSLARTALDPTLGRALPRAVVWPIALALLIGPIIGASNPSLATGFAVAGALSPALAEATTRAYFRLRSRHIAMLEARVLLDLPKG